MTIITLILKISIIDVLNRIIAIIIQKIDLEANRGRKKFNIFKKFEDIPYRHRINVKDDENGFSRALALTLNLFEND